MVNLACPIVYSHWSSVLSYILEFSPLLLEEKPASHLHIFLISTSYSNLNIASQGLWAIQDFLGYEQCFYTAPPFLPCHWDVWALATVHRAGAPPWSWGAVCGSLTIPQETSQEPTLDRTFWVHMLQCNGNGNIFLCLLHSSRTIHFFLNFCIVILSKKHEYIHFLCKCSWPKKIQKHPSVCRRKAQWRMAGGPWLFLIFNPVKCFQVTGWFVPLSSICLNSCSEAWKGTFIWWRKRMFRDLGAMTRLLVTYIEMSIVLLL